MSSSGVQMTRPNEVHHGDIVVYPLGRYEGNTEQFSRALVGDRKGFRVVEKGVDWIRLEAIYPDLDLFPEWVEEVGVQFSYLKFNYKPTTKGSVDGYWLVFSYNKKAPRA